MSVRRSSQRVLIGLLVLISLLSHVLSPTASARDTSSPVLSVATAVALPSTLISVQGDGFSSGGLVYLAVYDRWGTELHDHVWTVASTAHYGTNGSADPAQGYVPAGTIDAVIDLYPATVYGTNGSQDPAQGFRQSVDAVPAPAAIYGPNGSQDPAQGYVPGVDQVTVGVSCGRDLMVRAYDQQGATWSNLLDIRAAC
jgi:hypothetical protein